MGEMKRGINCRRNGKKLIFGHRTVLFTSENMSELFLVVAREDRTEFHVNRLQCDHVTPRLGTVGEKVPG